MILIPGHVAREVSSVWPPWHLAWPCLARYKVESGHHQAPRGRGRIWCAGSGLAGHRSVPPYRWSIFNFNVYPAFHSITDHKKGAPAVWRHAITIALAAHAPVWHLVPACSARLSASRMQVSACAPAELRARDEHGTKGGQASFVPCDPASRFPRRGKKNIFLRRICSRRACVFALSLPSPGPLHNFSWEVAGSSEFHSHSRSRQRRPSDFV